MTDSVDQLLTQARQVEVAVTDDLMARVLADAAREQARQLPVRIRPSRNGDIIWKCSARVQVQAVKMGSSKSLTRASGAALLHIGATHISTALTGDAVRSKQQLRVRRSVAY